MELSTSDSKAWMQYQLIRNHLSQTFMFTYLHQVDEVQEELVGILLSVGGKLWVSPADQGLQHPGRDALLLVLK